MIRYFGNYLLDTLEKRRLKVSIPSKLNDPFDFSLAPVGELTIDRALEIVKERYADPAYYDHFRRTRNVNSSNEQIRDYAFKHILKAAQMMVDGQEDFKDHYIKESHKLANEDCRLLCFSKPDIDERADILMWSHYGYSHSGFRVHFDVSFLIDAGITNDDVTYSEERVKMPIDISPSDPRFREILLESMRTKGKFWDYEREKRFFISPLNCFLDEETQLEYFKFPVGVITRIDIGIRADNKIVENVLRLLKRKEFKGAEVYQSEMDDTGFLMKYEKVN